MKGWRVFGVNTNQAVLPQFDPFRQLSWRAPPFKQLCCGVWEILATMKITVSQKLAVVQTSTGSILLSGEIPILCQEHCVTDWKIFLKISTLYCITEDGFQCHWKSVSNHWMPPLRFYSAWIKIEQEYLPLAKFRSRPNWCFEYTYSTTPNKNSKNETQQLGNNFGPHRALSCIFICYLFQKLSQKFLRRASQTYSETNCTSAMPGLWKEL